MTATIEPQKESVEVSTAPATQPKIEPITSPIAPVTEEAPEPSTVQSNSIADTEELSILQNKLQQLKEIEEANDKTNQRLKVSQFVASSYTLQIVIVVLVVLILILMILGFNSRSSNDHYYHHQRRLS